MLKQKKPKRITSIKTKRLRLLFGKPSKLKGITSIKTKRRSLLLRSFWLSAKNQIVLKMLVGLPIPRKQFCSKNWRWNNSYASTPFPQYGSYMPMLYVPYFAFFLHHGILVILGCRLLVDIFIQIRLLTESKQFTSHHLQIMTDLIKQIDLW